MCKSVEICKTQTSYCLKLCCYSRILSKTYAYFKIQNHSNTPNGIKKISNDSQLQNRYFFANQMIKHLQTTVQITISSGLA